MQAQKTNLNALVEQCLVSLNLDPSPPPPLEEEGKKPYYNTGASSSSNALPSYPSFMDYPISQTRNPNSSSSNLIGDYIGVESCLDLDDNMDFSSSRQESISSNGDRVRNKLLLAAAATTRRMERRTKREFPPPIPLLARTENLPSHMPWVLRRYYTDDGRLILREERVRHHEYFKAHRAGGRLTLQLVLMDDDFPFPPCDDDDNDDNDQIEERHCCDEEVGGGGERESTVCSEEEGDEDGTSEDEEEEEDISGGGGGGASSSSSCLEGGSKCLSYIPVRGSSTCIFRVPVPALRPVS